MTAEKRIVTWDKPEDEAAMQSGHDPSWRAMIAQIDEDNLADKDVLDFGCNRGGFLRLLHQLNPFHSAVGVDIAEESIAFAERNKNTVPVRYAHNDELHKLAGSFDIAFSHEVVYLLPDLEAHARQIHDVLKPGGVYYLVIGEYAENPLWDRWQKTITDFSPVPPQNWSLQDIAKAFAVSKFSIAVRRLHCDGFLPYDPMDNKYLRSPMELIDFMTRYMMMFRMVKI